LLLPFDSFVLRLLWGSRRNQSVDHPGNQHNYPKHHRDPKKFQCETDDRKKKGDDFNRNEKRHQSQDESDKSHL
jgi:hypothetical protein